jgi:REP element-mobilizing transposase RayT
MRQSSFKFSQQHLFHGGLLSRGRRKRARPLSAKMPLHLVLKSKRNIYSSGTEMERLARRLGERFHLKIYSVAVAKDHLHLVLRIPDRRSYAAYVRSLTGIAARKFGSGLWALLPFSRLGHWGKDFRSLLQYLEKNRREASGEWAYTPRNHRYRLPLSGSA